MKIEITPQTKFWFSVELENTTDDEPSANFDRLCDAEEYADWCENNGYKVKRLVLIAES